jgi:UDP-N-acetylmuramate dehydrogenase
MTVPSTLDALAAELRSALGPAAVQAKQPLARYTAIRIGGPADLLVIARSVTEICQAVTLARDRSIPCRVLGAASNVLVSDRGVQGLVVLNRARGISFLSPPNGENGRGDERVRADSGASLSTVARQCVARGLAGLEWATGIPGTVGGAIVGNAGAWGGDVASSLIRASVLLPEGSTVDWPVERFHYSYRSSALKHKGSAGEQAAVVLEAEFALREADRTALQAQVAEITARRKATQPPGASCGSIFRNPPGDHAGRLIEAAGLKGTRAGAAEISPLHANFVINHGHATAAEVKALIDTARDAVQAKSGVTLELEIELIGKW